MKIQIQNPDLSEEERTYLDADYATSATTLTVRNNDGATTNWFVVVGEPGQEQTECRIISSTIGNTTITLGAALRFNHTKGTPVYISRWNQWAVYSSTNGTVYAAITSSPFDIQWDNSNLCTTVVDDSGSSSSYYKWRGYNSTAGTYSSYSDVLVGTGLERDSVGHALTQVKRSPLAKGVDDETIMEFFNDFQDLVYEETPTAWWFRKEGTAVATEANTYKYSISTNWSDFESMQYLLYEYISGDDIDITYPLTWSPTSEFYNLKSDSNQSDDDYAKYWTILPPDSSSEKGYIGLHPTPKTDDCYIKPVYLRAMTAIDSFADTLLVPRTKGYVDYALFRIADDIKLDSANSEKYSSRVAASIIALKKRAKRQLGQPEFMRFRGVRGFSRLFGEQSRLSSSESKENYW